MAEPKRRMEDKIGMTKDLKMIRNLEENGDLESAG